MKDKKQLRSELFELLKTGEGISINELTQSIVDNINIWDELNSIIENNIVDYNGYSKAKIINEYKQYLIIKMGTMHYLIIDRNKGKSISKIDLDKSYFIENFDEVTWGNVEKYTFDKYKGDVTEFLTFIENNRHIFFSSNYILKKARIKDQDAKDFRSYLSLNVKTGSIQLCFYSLDFSIYDCLIIRIGDSFEDFKSRNRRLDSDMLQYYDEINNFMISEELVPDYLKNHDKTKTLEKVS